MYKNAAAVFQEITSQPQYEKLAFCLYQDIQTRAMEKLANLTEMEKLAYNEALYRRGYPRNGYARHGYSNAQGPDLVTGLKTLGGKVFQGIKDIFPVAKKVVRDPKRMKAALNITLGDMTLPEMENMVMSNAILSDNPVASTISTGADALGLISRLKRNFDALG